MKKKLVIFSGAGISAESGIPTFRDSGGLWENYDIEDVATPDGWKRNKELVLDFYNKMRAKLKDYKPNRAHEVIKELEDHYDVIVVTQNVDDLHERAGTSKNKVIHLHGELLKSRSTVDNNLKYECEGDINIGDKCEKGSQLRPDIVWFHEDVYHIQTAAEFIGECDVLVIVGTSLNVWPAAGLIHVTKEDAEIYCVDPANSVTDDDRVNHIKANATVGMEQLKEILIKRKGEKKPCCW